MTCAIGSVGAVWLVGGVTDDDATRGIHPEVLRDGEISVYARWGRTAHDFGASWSMIRNPDGVVSTEPGMMFDQFARRWTRWDGSIVTSAMLKAKALRRQAVAAYAMDAGHLPRIYLGNPAYPCNQLATVKLVSDLHPGCPIDLDGVGGDWKSEGVVRALINRGHEVGVEPFPRVPAWIGSPVTGVMQSNYFRKVDRGERDWRLPERPKHLGRIFVEERPAPTLAEVASWLARGYHVALPIGPDGTYLGATGYAIAAMALRAACDRRANPSTTSSGGGA